MASTCEVAAHTAVCSNHELQSPTVQLGLEVQFLCLALHVLDGTWSCSDFNTILADAGAFACQSAGRNRLIAAEIMIPLALAPEKLHCFNPQQLEAMRTFLICKLASVLT